MRPYGRKGMRGCLWRDVVGIQGPSGGIIVDVATDAIQIVLVADDVVVVAALP